MKGTVTVVAGLGRCGSSLMMQMLHAAGMRCAGEWPGFEPEEVRTSPSVEFVASMVGGAFKLLDPHLNALPVGFHYRFFFLTRSRKQQSASMEKFLAVNFPYLPRLDALQRQTMEAGLANDEQLALAALAGHPGHSIYTIRFEDLIDRPDLICDRVAFATKLEAKAMRPCIRKRSSACLEGMLEFDLLAKEVEQ